MAEEAEPYYSESDPPDADHPRAGWYVALDEDGDVTVFGPFTTKEHAKHFAVYTQDQDHDH